MTIRSMFAGNEVVQVRGRVFEIPALPGTKFVVHRPLNNKTGWTASEATTGENVCWPPRSSSVFAIEAVEERIGGMDKARIAYLMTAIQNGQNAWKRFDAGVAE